MAEKTITVCDHCGRKPKLGLRKLSGLLTEGNGDDSPRIDLFKRDTLLCISCRDRVCRFMERGFTAKQK